VRRVRRGGRALGGGRAEGEVEEVDALSLGRLGLVVVLVGALHLHLLHVGEHRGYGLALYICVD
jgi:hypothetical protein